MEEELLYWFVPSTGASCLSGTVGGAGETAVDGPAWSLPLHRFSSGMQPSLYYHSACNAEPFVFLLLVCFPICKMRTWRKSGWLPGLTLLWLLPWIPWFVLRSIKAAPCSMPLALAGMMLSQNWPRIFAKATHDWNSKAGLRPDSLQPDQERESTFHRGKKKMKTACKRKPASLETCWAPSEVSGQNRVPTAWRLGSATFPDFEVFGKASFCSQLWTQSPWVSLVTLLHNQGRPWGMCFLITQGHM